ncbi:MAG: valine--pyruvate transaminase, partial [Gammaproteobacteria bacterium]|nr:valine--pyruvate transaminase [Gammaproteobacteria bacterium]
LLRSELGWPITPANIALTNGSQTAFFILFNIFAGQYEHGPNKRVLLPLAPEYIGYADIGIDRDLFLASRPGIDHLDEHIFKYRIDTDALAEFDRAEDIGAICVSRPTNPTGNVLTDVEIDQLSNLARQRGIPLIIDSAYGTPFPNIIFTAATPIWDKGIIVTMSLSKLGLPGLRTGIVIADEDVIHSIAGANAILSLATGSFGPALTEDLIRSGAIMELSRQQIQPFYQNRADDAMQWLAEYMDGVPYRVHKPEGAIFLWLWFPELPIDSETLYQRLKQRRVLVIAGHHFFPGLQDDWRHRYECIRVTYSQDPDTVREGIRIIADEVRRAYTENASSSARKA